jgi:hypothetical protein
MTGVKLRKNAMQKGKRVLVLYNYFTEGVGWARLRVPVVLEYSRVTGWICLAEVKDKWLLF